MPLLICLAIALHDVDGPIHCADGTKLRLQGIGALEIDGTCRPNQPCAPGDPFEQRRRMAKLMGAKIARETRSPNGGQLYFAEPVRLTYEPVGKSYKRVTAWVKLPDGRDLSCLAIRAGVAARWDRYDGGGRLRGC
jgi:endonuclease YncB( thermonuclease family)